MTKRNVPMLVTGLGLAAIGLAAFTLGIDEQIRIWGWEAEAELRLERARDAAAIGDEETLDREAIYVPATLALADKHRPVRNVQLGVGWFFTVLASGITAGGLTGARWRRASVLAAETRSQGTILASVVADSSV
jgi:hypothetical protein